MTGRRWWRWIHRVDPDTVPLVACVPVVFLLLTALVFHIWALAAAATGLAGAALAAQWWLERRQQHLIHRALDPHDAPIADQDRNTRRTPPEERDG